MAHERYDWELIEIGYRTSCKSLRQLAKEFGCTEKAIRDKVKRAGWVRDLSGRIRDKSADIIVRHIVRNEAHSTAARATEAQIIAACAQTYADITMRQRESINRSQDLYDELHKQLVNLPDESPLPVKIDCFKKLIESQKTVIGLQRLVYGMSDNADGDAPAKPAAIEPGGDFVNAMLERLRSKHESG